jgi:pyruvate formate lyase activating enzyme
MFSPADQISDAQRSHSRVRECLVCGEQSSLVSRNMGACLRCIREQPEDVLPHAHAAHEEARAAFGLPLVPPQAAGGVRCALCARECRIGEGERGFCGLRTVESGRLRHLAGTRRAGLLEWYRDPLPTNCVADWVCSGSRQRGKHNLAVFYASCTLDCLFCQNWHFRAYDVRQSPLRSAEDLAAAANAETYCVCFFGGDPASQMPHALASAERLARRGVVICWETAGTSHPRLLERAVHLSLVSGGCIKFDLKAYDEALHIALTGASNRRTLENFARAVRFCAQRRHPPLVVASTLLVPGYVDAEEVGRIARLIAELDPAIPYALLGFAPHFYMSDLPRTSYRHALAAQDAARAAGLLNVRIGNRHLLSDEY